MLTLDLLRKEVLPVARRLRFYADLPMVARILKFKPVRARFLEKIWQDASAHVGADFCVLDGGFLRISKGSAVTHVRGNQVMLDSALMLDLMGDKAITLNLLENLRVPVPGSVRFTIDDMAPALALLEKYRLLVVKPGSGTGGGRGITTGITTRRELAKAAGYAARFGKRLVAEQQVEGENYRLLYVGGKFVDAVRRDPPGVWGDGKSSIRKLVSEENARRLYGPKPTALNPLVLDGDAKLWLRSRGLKPSDIPQKGLRVQVKRAVNENNRRENLAVGHKVSTHIREECGRICRALGVELAGVDIYCHNISGAFAPDNCIIGEINTTPGLHHHYLVANPASLVPVAERILEHVFATGVGVMQLNPVMQSPKLDDDFGIGDAAKPERKRAGDRRNA